MNIAKFIYLILDTLLILDFIFMSLYCVVIFILIIVVSTRPFSYLDMDTPGIISWIIILAINIFFIILGIKYHLFMKSKTKIITTIFMIIQTFTIIASITILSIGFTWVNIFHVIGIISLLVFIVLVDILLFIQAYIIRNNDIIV